MSQDVREVELAELSDLEQYELDEEARIAKLYPKLVQYSDPVKAPERDILGREYEMSQVLAALERPEVSNVLLLASAGSGKTALVQAVMLRDTQRLYLEIDVSRLVSGVDSTAKMAAELKALFDEAERFSLDENRQLVLFIDEFHQIIQLSDAAVEALKPVLAASGARGIRVIAATTYEEFHLHISKNQPLVERLQRINLSSPDRLTTIEILKAYAERYGVLEKVVDEMIFHLIYEYTDRDIPSSSQPRKSILVLDGMIGWHRHTGRPLDRELLADVMQESVGVNLSIRVDGSKIEQQLNRKIFGQRWAIRAVTDRMQVAVADLHDKSRPISSFLFTGSTGVGKATTASTPIPVYTEDGSVAWKLAGNLLPGDYTFTRRGTPQKVLGVFPQGEREVYRVTLGDGRTLDVSDNHLWAVYPSRQSREDGPTIYSTQTLINKGLESKRRNGRIGMKYSIPMNHPVQWPEADLPVDPYVIGAFIANGFLGSKDAALFSSDDEETVARVGERMGAVSWRKRSETNYDWVFRTTEYKKYAPLIQHRDIFGDIPEMCGVKSSQRSIPEQYMHSSIDQRWELVRGLFDCDGSIGQRDGDRFNVSYSTTSEKLAYDVQQLLFSLGVQSSVNCYTRERDGEVLCEYKVHVKVVNDHKHMFFHLSRKRDIALKAQGVNKQRVKTFDYVGIRSIERLGYTEDMVCIYVDDDEHLYQAGQFVVTHNTELAKQLSHLVYGDAQQHFIRFDMSEYSLEDSVDMFRTELTRRVWDTSHAVILFDEIEKAAANVIRLLLQVLDDGRLSDQHNREVSFLNTYIIMTTNAGSEIYKTIAQYNVDDEGSGEQLQGKMREIKRSIRTTQGDNRFPPELLGRIDQIVPFQPLSWETLRRVVQGKMLNLVEDVLRKHGVRLNIDESVLTYIVDEKADNDSDEGGARGAIRVMNEELLTKVARFINHHPDVRHVDVFVQGRMRTVYTDVLQSEAKIEVQATGGPR